MARTILAIDDSEVMRWTISTTLERFGYTVVTAVDGMDALEKLKGLEKVHLIITDVHMPNMDGLTFIGEVRKNAKYTYTPIIVLTTEVQAEKKEEGKKAGATGWVVKPFKPDQLIATVKKVCP
ncbi:MAG: response regulator [Deltaproteobacteria bacterium]|nr:response regulator [Deltaproteobacteria bacterium]